MIMKSVCVVLLALLALSVDCEEDDNCGPLETLQIKNEGLNGKLNVDVDPDAKFKRSGKILINGETDFVITGEDGSPQKLRKFCMETRNVKKIIVEFEGAADPCVDPSQGCVGSPLAAQSKDLAGKGWKKNICFETNFEEVQTVSFTFIPVKRKAAIRKFNIYACMYNGDKGYGTSGK